MIGVMIIPTGIGAAIGGHAGDGNPACKLIASCCDILITHPNVVNAADINEMAENVWYVEGSILDRFLEGGIYLTQPLQNKILVATNKPIRKDTINAISASRVTSGVNAKYIELDTELKMIAEFKDGIATGSVIGWRELIKQVEMYDFDALALHTPIDVSSDVAEKYFREGGVNPWGGVEAKASRLIAFELGKPVAHAPTETETDENILTIANNEILDPRITPETMSSCYLHCVLKGLNKAPRISNRGMSVEDVDFLISPYGCWGRPHEYCYSEGIPVIMVKENKTIMNEVIPGDIIDVENYWEAVGVIMSMSAGIDKMSVRRPIGETIAISK